MSARRPRIALASDAQRDFRNILVYTEQHWGRSQRSVYRQRLRQAFLDLQAYPDLGSARIDIGDGIRALRVGQHVIIYQPTDTEILIVRILHIRRDVQAEFD